MEEVARSQGKGRMLGPAYVNEAYRAFCVYVDKHVPRRTKVGDVCLKQGLCNTEGC